MKTYHQVVFILLCVVVRAFVEVYQDANYVSSISYINNFSVSVELLFETTCRS